MGHRGFVFYQYVGVSKKGLKYFKHFLGPVPVMAPFMLPLEIIGEFARPFSIVGSALCQYFRWREDHIAAFRHTRHWPAGGLDDVDSVITIPIQAFIFPFLPWCIWEGQLRRMMNIRSFWLLNNIFLSFGSLENLLMPATGSRLNKKRIYI